MAVISFCMRSAIPGYMAGPPERTVLAERSLRRSMSDFMMELKQPSWMPTTSMPKKAGRNIDSEIDVRLHDGVEAALVDANNLHAQESRAEHRLGAAETLVAYSHDLSVGQLVGLLDGRGRGGGGHLLLKVQSDVAELLLDIADDLALGGGDHGITALGHDLHEVVGQVASGQVET